jgi:two-component system phosphate regulon response regulator PhoB
VILSEAADQLRVLLVEDDRAIADMYRYKLELDGYEVSVAGGDTAILVANESLPDLIFLEVQVPNLDAALALEQFRRNERTRDVPVVVLTDHDDVELRRHGFVLGPLDHVIDTTALTDSVRRPRTQPQLQAVPGSEPMEGSSLMSGYFSGEAFGA